MLLNTGATPNLSNTVRSMPNIEWAAAWSAGPEIPKTMPDEVFQTLSPDAQHYCRFVHAVRANDRLPQSVVGTTSRIRLCTRRLCTCMGT